jgi:mannose-6-phosphate isomerase-like protein (cupin superfamily)
MPLTRREICEAAPIVLIAAKLCSAQSGKPTIPSGFFHFDKLPARAAGSLTYRPIIEGKIFEGCHIDLHESDLAPHSIPHPPHHHRHEEMVLIVEGTLEFTINGQAIRAGAGSVAFFGSGDMHGIRNTENSHAKYFVFALGGDS